jgi:cell wall-associated NlpC family hydrolase
VLYPGATASRRSLLNGNKRIPCCAPGGIPARLNGVTQAALAVLAVLLTSVGLAVPTAVEASNASGTHDSRVQISSDQASFAQASSAQASFRAQQASSAQALFRARQASSAQALLRARQASSAPVSFGARQASSLSATTSATAATQVLVRVWRYALAQRGKPYIWGGTGPTGFDCSGLVYAAYRAAGITLPRTTYEMLSSSRLIRIAKSQARQGDLAFFGTGHVELYDAGLLTYGAQRPGTVIGFHQMNAFWQPTMYFRVRL